MYTVLRTAQDLVVGTGIVLVTYVVCMAIGLTLWPSPCESTLHFCRTAFLAPLLVCVGRAFVAAKRRRVRPFAWSSDMRHKPVKCFIEL